MVKRISLFIAILMLLSTLALLSSCGGHKFLTPPTINGTALGEFTIVYDESGLDYNKRAAEYIKNTALERYGVELAIVDDGAAVGAHEIVVGETSRDISALLDEETDGLESSILANGGHVALEGDYFVIAAAAYFFMETYASGDAQVS